MLTCKGEDDNSKSACCRHQTKEEKYFPLGSAKLTDMSKHLCMEKHFGEECKWRRPRHNLTSPSLKSFQASLMSLKICWWKMCATNNGRTRQLVSSRSRQSDYCRWVSVRNGNMYVVQESRLVRSREGAVQRERERERETGEEVEVGASTVNAQHYFSC